MRGVGSLIFLALFLLFVILKLFGKVLRAGKAALDGDLKGFFDVLDSDESKKVRAATRYLRAKLAASDSESEEYWRTNPNAHKQLGYAFTWATLLWHTLPPLERMQKSKAVLATLFGPHLNFWMLAGVLIDKGSDAFGEGLDEGLSDYLSFVGANKS